MTDSAKNKDAERDVKDAVKVERHRFFGELLKLPPDSILRKCWPRGYRKCRFCGETYYMHHKRWYDPDYHRGDCVWGIALAVRVDELNRLSCGPSKEQ